LLFSLADEHAEIHSEATVHICISYQDSCYICTYKLKLQIGPVILSQMKINMLSPLLQLLLIRIFS